MAGSIREALEAAFDEQDEEKDGETAVVEREEKPAPIQEAVEEELNPQEPVVPPEGTKPEVKPLAEETKAVAASPAVMKPPKPAPVSWRPKEREKFGSLPEDVQAEIMRREGEITQGLRDAADARKFRDEFSTIAAPYQAIFAAERVTAAQAAGDLFRSAAVLRTGQPQQKAQLVAELIGQFNIDLGMLDTVLAARISGKQVQIENNPMMDHINRQLQPVVDFVRQQQQSNTQGQERETRQLQSTLEAFATDPKNEFYNDVAPDIADILDMAARRGTAMTLQEAYDRATMLHPQISEVISARKLAAKASQRSADAKKARRAGASVPGGAPQQQEVRNRQPVANESDNRRSAIEAAWDALEE